MSSSGPGPARIIQWALAVAGVAAASWTVGQWGAGQPVGFETSGGALVLDGALTMPAGSWASFSDGVGIEVSLAGRSRSLDLLYGPLDELVYYAHVGEAVAFSDTTDGKHPRHYLSIHNDRGDVIGQGCYAQSFASGTVAFDCEPPLTFNQGPGCRAVAEPSVKRGCRPAPMGIYAREPLQVTGVSVDGAPVALAGETSDRRAAAQVAGLGIASVALLGPAAFYLLLLAPAAGSLGATLGVPAASLLWLLFGAGASERLFGGSGWRRALAGLACLMAVGMAGRTWSETLQPLGVEATASDNAVLARALEATTGISEYLGKVNQAVKFYRPAMRELPDDKPLVVTLGSSSTGGNQPRGFWPGFLMDALPEAHVQTLAWGGSTTWHMRKLLDELEVKADACVIFMGHNDTIASTPRQSLASMERGDPPQSRLFVPPVPLPDAEENLRALANDHCEVFIGMEEYSIGREDDLDAYAAMMDRMPEMHYLDVAELLRQRPSGQVMSDPVHPNVVGSRIIGERVAEELRVLLALE